MYKAASYKELQVSYLKVSGWFILLVLKHFFTSCFVRKRRGSLTLTLRDSSEEMRDGSKDKDKDSDG